MKDNKVTCCCGTDNLNDFECDTNMESVLNNTNKESSWERLFNAKGKLTIGFTDKDDNYTIIAEQTNE